MTLSDNEILELVGKGYDTSSKIALYMMNKDREDFNNLSRKEKEVYIAYRKWLNTRFNTMKKYKEVEICGNDVDRCYIWRLCR